MRGPDQHPDGRPHFVGGAGMTSITAARHRLASQMFCPHRLAIFRLDARIRRLELALRAYMGDEAATAYMRFGRPYESVADFNARWPEADPESWRRWSVAADAVRLAGVRS